MNSMKPWILVALAALWMAGSTGWAAEDKDHQTLTGVLSNTHCGLNHSKADAGQSGCVNMCIKSNNASYALVTGGKLIKLDGLNAELAKLAGQSVKLTGHVKGNSMQVEKAEAGK